MSAQAVEERKDVAGEPEKAAAAVESGGAPAQPAAKPPVRAKLATPSVAAAGLLRQNGAAAPD
ncbi:MAG TPA: hypothetical protein PLP17_10125, partial [Oligoflexia bacterium]|nr:hypothetical protein [Oligoflexia bacterium]